jgi:hypothetical protein
MPRYFIRKSVARLQAEAEEAEFQRTTHDGVPLKRSLSRLRSYRSASATSSAPAYSC